MTTRRAAAAPRAGSGDAAVGSVRPISATKASGVVSEATSGQKRTQNRSVGAIPTGDSRHSGLEEHLARSIEAAGLPVPERQHRFAASIKRQWRFDFCWRSQMLAVEVEGGIYRGGWHTNATGLKRDIEKSNTAVLMGWRVLRFHGDQVRSGEAVELIRQALAAREQL